MSLVDLMNKNVRSVEPSMTAQDVIRLMSTSWEDPVAVTEEGRLIGFVSARVLLTEIIAKDRLPAKALVKEIMGPVLFVCRVDETLEQVEKRMLDNYLKRLFVVDSEGKLVGIVAHGALQQWKLDEKNRELDKKTPPSFSGHGDNAISGITGGL